MLRNSLKSSLILDSFYEDTLRLKIGMLFIPVLSYMSSPAALCLMKTFYDVKIYYQFCQKIE